MSMETDPAPHTDANDPGTADALFDRLLDESDAERERVLSDESLDKQLRSRVRRLLDLAASAPPDFDAPKVTAAVVESVAAPRRIGDFEVLGVLGSGAMGVVYRARQTHPAREVAIKLLPATEGASRLARFEREAGFLARLQHRGIAQVFEAGQVDLDFGTSAYIAMELVQGTTLTEYVRSREPDLKERVRLLVDIAEAIHHAHLRGVIHRDLKPGNVLVTDNGEVKVIDFGVARDADEDRRGTLERTLPGQVVGTLAYMSPEQVQAESAGIDARTDVYSLGALGFELFSGTVPHELGGTTLAEAARRIVERDARRLGSVAPSCRGDLDAIVGRALEKDRERRFQSASAMADDLRRHLRGEPVESRPAGALYHLRLYAARHRAIVGGVVATLLAIIAGSLVAFSYALENRDLARLESNARQDAEREAERAGSEAERANENAAESARLAAVAERQLADLKLVTGWQAERLASLDVFEFGGIIQSALRAEVEAGNTARGAAPDVVEGQLERLLELLDDVNLTNVAREALTSGVLGDVRTTLDERFADRPTLQAELLLAHAKVLENIGATQDSVATSRHARSLFEQAQGKNSASVARATMDLGILLFKARDYGAAYAEFAEYSEGLNALAETGFAEAIVSVGWHGVSAGSLGRLDEAIALFRWQIELIELHGVETPERTQSALVEAQLNLAGTLIAAEVDLAEAEQLLVSGVESLRHDPANASRLMGAVVRLGRLQLQLERIQEAEASHTEALRLARAIYGDAYLNLTSFLEGLASVYSAQGRLDEALELRREAYDLHLAKLGPEHEQTKRVGLVFATALLESGELEQAHTLCEDVYLWTAENYGAADPRTELARTTLLRILVAREEVEGPGTFEDEIRRLESDAD